MYFLDIQGSKRQKRDKWKTSLPPSNKIRFHLLQATYIQALKNRRRRLSSEFNRLAMSRIARLGIGRSVYIHRVLVICSLPAPDDLALFIQSD